MTKISFNYSWTITTTWSVFFLLLLIFWAFCQKTKILFFSITSFSLFSWHFFIKKFHKFAVYKNQVSALGLFQCQNNRKKLNMKSKWKKKKNLHEIICHKTNVLPRPRNAKKWQEYKVHSCISFNRWLRVGI